MVDHSRQIGYALHRSFNMLPDPWARWLGYDLYRTRELPAHAPAALRNHRIYLHDGLGQVDELLAIGHEHTHDRFHPDCIAYAELDLFDIELQELQADCGAVIALYPDLSGFESIEQFQGESIMPEYFTNLRLTLKRYCGVD